jgi:corrinoid protein of di/trimethylamine methyltransferase
MTEAEQIYEMMKKSIEEFDSEAAVAAAEKAVEAEIDLLEAVEKGFSGPIRELGEAFDRMEIFLPQLTMGADAMKAGVEVLEKALNEKGSKIEKKGLVVIGTVEGDIHDIGKSVVATLLQANGYQVQDLGVDIPAVRFIEAAESAGADIIALSALLSTTMLHQRDVVELLNNKGMRENYFIIIGGAPVTREWADDIGADGYARGAYEAVKLLDSKKEGWAE